MSLEPERARELRRAGVRAGLVALGLVGLEAVTGLSATASVVLGLACGGLALLEPWVARGRSTGGVDARALVGLALAAAAFVAAELQAIYVEGVWARGSIAQGFEALAHEVRLARLEDYFLLVWGAETFATSAAAVLLVRALRLGRPSSEPPARALVISSAAFFLVLASVGCMLVDAIAFAVLVPSVMPAGLDRAQVFLLLPTLGAIALAVAATFGSLALVTVSHFADRLEARFWPAGEAKTPA